MVLLQMQMQREVAHDTVLTLGNLGVVQFVDLNKGATAFSRTFTNEVRRCDDMERRLRYFQEQLAKTPTIPELKVRRDDARETMDTLEAKLEERETELRDLTSKFEQMTDEMNRNREFREVLARDSSFFQGRSDQLIERGAGGAASGGGLGFLTGVIPKAKFDTFERLVFRATRGNTFLRSDQIKEPFTDPVTGDKTVKVVFAVFFSAQRAKEKITKLCESLQATLYPYTEGREAKARQEVDQQMSTLGATLAQTSNRRDSLLKRIASEIVEWRRLALTEKSVYNIMNMLQFKGVTVIAEAWAPQMELQNIERAIKQAEQSSGAQCNTLINVIPTKEKHPTYFQTNKITEVFQGIVDSYGIARYKEVNPGVLTIITFPYLFGVMYGDVGHGIIMTCFAAFLVIRENDFLGKPMNEIFGMIFGGRYLILLMGLFATYVGILYNDMFGISTEMFASGYTWPELHANMTTVTPLYPSGRGAGVNVNPDSTVVFGIDAAWAETENKLEFYNSVKMKCAIIIGVIQMLAGLVLSLMNHLYFKDWKHIIFGFIPEVIFLMCTFGYMAIIIIVKWCSTFAATHDAPSLLETMTNFFLSPGTVTQELYSGQAGLQAFLLLVAFFQVPLMLIPIPYLEWKHHKDKTKPTPHSINQSTHQDVFAEDTAPLAHGGAAAHGAEAEDEEPFDFSEVVIHQVIHTIEFVLGCVSNTASYLRLWALSLAHAELSDVFWNFAFMMAIDVDQGSGIVVFIGFAVWLGATIGVLLMMESLSAFLHALRLHWVEFQNKFYAGDGIKFSPFSLTEIMTDAKLN
jgi:V-type H+-transporting ATPase subunit a